MHGLPWQTAASIVIRESSVSMPIAYQNRASSAVQKEDDGEGERSDMPLSQQDQAAGLTPDVPAKQQVTAAGPITSAFSLVQTPAPGEPIFVDFVHLKRQLPMARVLDQLGLTSRLKGKGPQKRCTCPIHRGAARTRFTRLSTLSSRLSRKTCGPVSRVCHCVTRPST